MKRTVKITALILSALMVVACFAACGSDNNGEQITPYTEKTFETYSSSGDYFFSTTEIPAFETLPLKDISGLRLSSLNSKFSFSAECEGDVKLYVWTAGISDPNKDVTVKVTVDGANTKTMRWIASGGDILIADDLPRGNHTFTVEKISGGANLYIGSVTLSGEMTEAPALSIENGIWVEVFAPVGGDDEYCSFNVYTQTTHHSGEYFIRYKFVYEYDDLDEKLTWSTGPNTGANRMNYRIKTGQIVKKSGSGFLTVYNILQNGEISLAIKEKNPETGASAGDFVGGFHGDENIKNAKLVLDGNTEIELYQGEAGLYNCTTVEFKQFTAIDRCHTAYNKVMNHNQHYLIDTNGIRLHQQVEWLTGDFTPSPNQTYLQMFTLYRENTDRVGDYLTTIVNLLDEDGKLLDSVDTTTITVPSDKESSPTSQSDKYRYAEYLGDEKGIYAIAGYQLVDNSCFANSAHVAVRRTQGDNKWYPSFKGATATPAAGEVWNVNSFYYIDYNPQD